MTDAVNGKAPETAPKDETIRCDRCGRTFPAKYVYCICKG